jgi:transposase-like protein
MTREEYKARRQAIVMDVLHGMTYAEAAREYGRQMLLSGKL